MLHGLSLLGPRIEQMAAHIEKLSKEVGDQRALLMQKAEQQDIAQLKQQLNHLGHGMAQKIDQLDRDAQESLGRVPADFQFMQSTVQKIDTLGGELQGTAGSGRVDHLEERLTKAFQAIERKAEAAAFRRLEEQVLEIGGYVETKAEMAQLQSAEEVLKVLEQSISKTAAVTDLEPLKRQLKELQSGKADMTLLDQIFSKERTLSTSLAEKADYVELEQLKIQVHALSEATAQQREASTQEAETFGAKLSALGAALGATCGAEEFRESVKELNSELNKKADASKLDLLTSQVEILSDVMAPKLRRANPPARQPPKTRKSKPTTGATGAEPSPPEHATTQ